MSLPESSFSPCSHSVWPRQYLGLVCGLVSCRVLGQQVVVFTHSFWRQVLWTYSSAGGVVVGQEVGMGQLGSGLPVVLPCRFLRSDRRRGQWMNGGV